ncbi:hypothetical protein MY4824_001791 [Beauveria thailandica]
MVSPNEHDMAAQQEAARAYQPTQDGPIIGDKTPIAAIIEEYAKADPIYVDKTMALPQTYMSYRPVKGDGNCGWRAIGFSYFEKLVEAGDADQVEGEAARLMSMNHFLGGYNFFEDLAEQAIGLLRELAGCVTDTQKARALIHERWTDPNVGPYLIYYLRVLAADHLKANSDQYDPFVPDGQGIVTYCTQSIELPDREIEQLGIIALYNCLLKPLDFVLEIAYLDRSPGAEVNTYRFPEEANGKDMATLGPMIHLLYRPDHYDILYRRPTVPSLVPAPDPVPVSMLVNRATNFYSHTPINSTHNSLGAFSTTDFGLLASLPSAPTSSMTTLSSPGDMQTPSSCGSFAPDGQWMPPLLTHASPNADADAIPCQRSHHPVTESALALSSSFKPPPPESECNIRFTKMHHHQEDSRRALLGPFPFNVTTTTFKNSVWNRAHFGNPEFRPEQWRPGDDSSDDRHGARRKKGGAKET